jgi:hypothetical protein
MANYLTDMFYGPNDHQAFCRGLQQAIDQLAPEGIFLGDQLFTFGRNLSFLSDASFMRAVESHARTKDEKGVIWRTYILCWAAKRALSIDGDFVECGCYKGVTARIVADYVGFGAVDRHFYLYDLFEHDSGMDHHKMDEHAPQLFESVKARFHDLANVSVIKGKVPESFSHALPDKIAFLHIDMNSPDAEIGALNVLFERVTKGAVVIFDDYGWHAYRAQKKAEDQFFTARGYQILELPTGQGLLIA